MITITNQEAQQIEDLTKNINKIQIELLREKLTQKSEKPYKTSSSIEKQKLDEIQGSGIINGCMESKRKISNDIHDL